MGYRCVTCALLLAGGLPSVLGAGEVAVLRSGYRLEVEEHERDGVHLRLLMANGGWVSLPDTEILEIVPQDRPIPAKPLELAGIAEKSDSQDASTAEGAVLQEAIDRFSHEAGIPASLVRAVIWAESGFRQEARSAQGAVGLMQLMPETAAALGVDPNDQMGNLEGGTRYLRQLLERYAGGKDQLVRALAAYNAGPAQVTKFGGLPPFPETVSFVAKVLRRFIASQEPDAAP